MPEYLEIVFDSDFSLVRIAGSFAFAHEAEWIPVGPAPKKPVRMILGQKALESVAGELLREEAVGLDVETTLTVDSSLCLMQFSLSAYNAVIDPFETASLEPLREVLESRRPIKIIHNAPFERGVLGRYGFSINGVYDTLSVSRSLRGRRLGGGHNLGAVCRRELGIGLNKVLQRSDWARRPLSREQLKYAAMDAEVLLDLYRLFRGEAGKNAR